MDPLLERTMHRQWYGDTPELFEQRVHAYYGALDLLHDLALECGQQINYERLAQAYPAADILRVFARGAK